MLWSFSDASCYCNRNLPPTFSQNHCFPLHTYANIHVKPVFTQIILSRHVRRSRSVDVVHPRHHSPHRLVFVTMGEMPFALRCSLPPPVICYTIAMSPTLVRWVVCLKMEYIHFTVHAYASKTNSALPMHFWTTKQ